MDNNAYIYPEYRIDITPLFEEFYFDGTVFKHTPCNSVIYSPPCKDIGILFELGRILHEYNLSIN